MCSNLECRDSNVETRISKRKYRNATIESRYRTCLDASHARSTIPADEGNPMTMPVRKLILVIAAAMIGAILAVSCSTPVPPIKQVGPAPESFRAAFETTRGSFVVQVN